MEQQMERKWFNLMERIICNGEVLEVMKKNKEIEKKIKWNKKNFIEKNWIQLKMSKKWMKWQAKNFIYLRIIWKKEY